MCKNWSKKKSDCSVPKERGNNMKYDVITMGDCMRDTFLFPNIEEMERPVSPEKIQSDEKFEEFLVFGLGDKITISEVDFSFGGTASNVAVGLAKQGYKSSIISVLGSDGEELIENLKTKHVSVEYLRVIKNKKTSFSVIVSYKGERTIFVYHAFGPEDFRLSEKINAPWLYLGPMAKGYERIFNSVTSQVIKNGLKIAMNPGSVQIDAGLQSFGGLLKLVNVIFLNRQEAQKLSGLPGIPAIKDVAKIINTAGPQIVVITDGKEGAYVYDAIDFLKVGAYPGHRLDATGAGDAFASAFLGGLLKDLTLRDCLKWGVVNSASAIEKVGAQDGLLSAGVIARRAKEYRWPADTLRFS